MHVAFSMLAAALLLIAARQDLLTRTVSNTVSVILFVAGATVRAFDGVAALSVSVLAAAGLAAVLAVAFARGVLGGADVKLMGAMAVGLPPATTWDFIVATAFAGGVIAGGYMLARHLLPRLAPAPRAPLLTRFAVVESWRIRTSRPMPYALAIAVGGIAVLILGFGA